MTATEAAILAILSSRNKAGLTRRDIVDLLKGAGVAEAEIVASTTSLVDKAFLTDKLTFTDKGIEALLDFQTTLERAIDKSPSSKDQKDCPTIPWLTKIETHWIEALSINYAVDPAVLQKLLPYPLEPEIHKGSAWVQVLVSSLRDLRPQGLLPLFGVCFYQVSYRAAVHYKGRRGGYFVRSETNHEVMRAVGNRLAEFKFHAFGHADIVMMREKQNLVVGIEPTAPGGKLVAIVDTSKTPAKPKGSVWESIDELRTPLVECYDAFGVDEKNKYLYTLTIDRDPWEVSFVEPTQLYCEYFEKTGRFDSILHLEKCRYRWRPLRREKFT